MEHSKFKIWLSPFRRARNVRNTEKVVNFANSHLANPQIEHKGEGYNLRKKSLLEMTSIEIAKLCGKKKKK